MVSLRSAQDDSEISAQDDGGNLPPVRISYLAADISTKVGVCVEENDLQGVTRKLLRRVEAVLDEGDPGLSDMKHIGAILKDIRDVQKEAQPKDTGPGELRVILEGSVAEYGG